MFWMKHKAGPREALGIPEASVHLKVEAPLAPEIAEAIQRDMREAVVENTDNNEALAAVIEVQQADEPVTIVERYDQIFVDSLERLHAAEGDLVSVIEHKSEELRQTRLAIAAAEAARARLQAGEKTPEPPSEAKPTAPRRQRKAGA